MDNGGNPTANMLTVWNIFEKSGILMTAPISRTGFASSPKATPRSMAIRYGYRFPYLAITSRILYFPLFFSQKGEAYTKTADKALSYDLNYLDIPVTLCVSREVADDLDVTLGFGPYLGIGLYGKNGTGSSSTEKHDSFGKDGELRRIDSGLIANIGLKYEDILLTVGGQYGFVNQLKDTKTLTGSPKNANFFVMVGYEF